MVRVSSPAKLRPWSELTAKMVMGVVPGLVTKEVQQDDLSKRREFGERTSCRTPCCSHVLLAEPWPVQRRYLAEPSKLPNLNSGKKKQHKRKLFGPDFPRTFLTLTPGRPWVKKFLHHRGRRKTQFLVRTSTIFAADVHDPKGSRKTLYKKSLHWFSGPYKPWKFGEGLSCRTWNAGSFCICPKTWACS